MAARALLLDLDGTLADSLRVMRDAYENLLRGYDRLPTEAEFRVLNGPPMAEGARLMKEKHGLQDSVEAIVLRWLGIVEDLYRDVAPTAGARELLGRARSAGWKIAVVTSGPQALARGWLGRVELAPLVDTVVGGDDVPRGKPDPAPYTEAIRRLAVTPGDCIAVEDSSTGAASAMAAGIRTYVIQPGELAVPQGTDRVRGLSDLAAVIA